MDYESSMGLKIPYVKKIFYIANTKIGSLHSYNITLEFEDEERVKDPDVVATFSVFTTSMANMYVHLGIFVMLGLSSALIADYCMTPILVRWSKPFGKLKL